MRPRRFGLCLALALAGVAHASPLDAALEPTEVALEELLERASTLESAATAGAGRVDAVLARERYELGLYHFLVGNHEAAAETFFVLAGRGTLGDRGLQTDAEWYLAESLFQLGFDDMAAEAAEAVVAQRDHPYREDAVRRLLEVYARANRPLDFDRVFEREILRGGVRPSDAILYAVGKSLRLRGERARARGYLVEVGPKGGWYLRARYMLGAMLVEDGGEAALREALGLFTAVAGADREAAGEEAVVIDLAWLALGRLRERLGDRSGAVEAYVAVPEDSAYAPDRTRELGWLHIHAGEWRAALAASQAFLERWPDHAYAAEQRLLLGHLQVQVGAWDAAGTAYRDVVDSYGPVRDAIAGLARDAEAPARVLADLQEEEGGLEGLPEGAVDLLRQTAGVKRAVALDGETTLIGVALTTAEELVAELAGALGPGAGGGPVEGLRLRALEVRLGLAGRRLDALRAESAWMAERGSPPKELAASDRAREEAEREVSRLSGRLERAAAQLAGGGAVDLDALERESDAALTGVEASIDALTSTLRGARAAAGVDVELDPQSLRLATLHGRAKATAERLDALAPTLKGMQSTELQRLQATYAAESRAVAAERAALDAIAVSERRVASELVRRELAQLAARYGERVMGAEMGLMNVTWSQWVEAGETAEALSEQRRDALLELERRYSALAAPLERAP